MSFKHHIIHLFEYKDQVLTQSNLFVRQSLNVHQYQLELKKQQNFNQMNQKIYLIYNLQNKSM